MGILEVCAVVLALAYVILAIFQRRLCWIAAIASAALYILIFWQVRLYLEAGLQVFYIAMGVYGWFAWQQKEDQSQAPIHTWSRKQHTVACSALVFLSLLIGSAMDRWTDGPTVGRWRAKIHWLLHIRVLCMCVFMLLFLMDLCCYRHC